jgi:hypothetical protein
MRVGRILALGALLSLGIWANAAQQKVAIRAYINVTSGCQAPTEAFLEGLQHKYAGKVSVEFIDFGDGGKGLARWRQSGYHCMTIEVNGWDRVKFPYGGKTRAVAFRMPVGLHWTHDDLEHAVQAALAGKLQQASEGEVATGETSVQVRAQVTTGSAVAKGKRYAAVMINGNNAVLIPESGKVGNASGRAEAAAAALRKWLSGGVKPSDLVVAHAAEGWWVLAGGKRVVVATAADGKATGMQPKAVAEAWVSGIRHGLVMKGH